MPQGIDIYFDNTGGKLLDAALLNMRLHGRIALRGMISQYILDTPETISNLMHLVYKRVRMEGFEVFDYYHLHQEFLETVVPYICEGKMEYVEDIVQGLHGAPAALAGIFERRNIGKLVVAVAGEYGKSQ